TLTTNNGVTGGPSSVRTLVQPAFGIPNCMDINATILVEGGGADGLTGVSSPARYLSFGCVGTLLSDTFAAKYPAVGAVAPMNQAGTVTELCGGPTPMVDTSRVPVRGAQPTGGITCYRGRYRETAGGAVGFGEQRVVQSKDAPGFGWPAVHPTTTNNWATTQGGCTFREWIAVFSSTYPRNYYSIARGDWTVTITGTRGAAAPNNWTDNGSSVTGP